MQLTSCMMILAGGVVITSMEILAKALNNVTLNVLLEFDGL